MSRTGAVLAGAWSAINSLTTRVGALESSGGGVGVAQRTTPEAYGAKGDCRFVSDANMSLSSAVLTSATANFASTDVGKWIMVRGAGLNVDGNTLTAQILSRQSATQVTLSVAAAVAVTNAYATFGTDDTAAFKNAVNAVTTAAINDGSYFAELLLSAKAYMIAGAPTMGGGTLGNAQIPLPMIDTRTRKLIFSIRGSGPSGQLYHWLQRGPQLAGSTLISPMIGAAADATYGIPSVIGGPTPTNLALDEGTQAFTNMLFSIDGVTIITPRNPSFVGVDLYRVAQAKIGSLSVLADASPRSDAPAGTRLQIPTNSQGLGLRMPRFQNNDLNEVDSFGCEGFYYGMALGDHFDARRLALIYCDTAMFVAPGGGPEHGMAVQYASIEACNTGLEATGQAGTTKLPITFGRVDIEVASGVTIKDPNSVLYGDFNYAHNASNPPTRTGATNIRIVDTNRARGTFTAPAVPASGSAVADSAMPWRDALVTITGGTVTAITVDGQTMFTSTAADRMVLVPSGKTISITYSVAPTWKWTLI